MTVEAIPARPGKSEFLRGAEFGMPVVIASAPFAAQRFATSRSDQT